MSQRIFSLFLKKRFAIPPRMCYGMAMAMCLGAAMDASQRKRRKAVLEEET